MKKVKILYTVSIIFVFCVLLALGCTGARIIDPDDLLSSPTETQMKSNLQKGEDDTDGKCNFVFVFYRYNGYYWDEADFARYGITENGHDTLILDCTLELDNEITFDVHIYGQNYDRISKAKLNRVMDAIESDVKDGLFVSASQDFALYGAKAYNGTLYNFKKAFFVGAVVGIGVAIVVFLATRASYQKKLRSPSYPLKEYTNLKLAVERDVFLDKHVTCVRVQSNSSGGHGGGGGGHSSGGRR